MKLSKRTKYILIAAGVLLLAGSLLALTGNIPGLRDGRIFNSAQKRDSGIKLFSFKKDFKSDEEPEIRFNYQKAGKGMINSVLESLGLSDGWKDISVKARIVYAGGNGAEIIPEVVYGQGGEVSVKASKATQGKPGAYMAVIKVEDNSGSELKTETLEKDFTWGVLAINANKSIFLPNEQAYLQMAALEDDGHTICDANLRLQIRNPKSEIRNFSTANETIKRSGKCSGNNVTDAPDYFAYYTIGEAGTYEMKLANLDNGYEITDSFEVRKSAPFEVERIGPTRIYPPAEYGVVLKIKANQDFKGEVTETVPASFEILNPKSEIQNSNDSNEKLIVWQADWKKGENYELRYQFDAPDISPEFYLLGPLEFYE